MSDNPEKEDTFAWGFFVVFILFLIVVGIDRMIKKVARGDGDYINWYVEVFAVVFLSALAISIYIAKVRGK